MPLVGGRNNAIPTLSSSASMISPLSALPSPWTSSPDNSSAFSPAASDTSATTQSSGGAAMRLTRVPTSVRLAAELFGGKPNQSAMSPPQQNLSLQTAGMPSANTSAAPSPVVSNQIEPTQRSFSGGSASARELAAFTSMPPPSLPHTKPPISIGKGRPTLSVPATPSSTRNPSFSDRVTGTTTDPVPTGRVSSAGNVAPPTSYKAPLLAGQASKSRPSAPPESTSADVAEPFSSQSKIHRYRTSMHEATIKSGFVATAESSNWKATASGRTGSTQASSQTSGLGLGFNIPHNAAHTPTSEPGEATAKPDPSNLPRLRSATGHGLAMDLAGISSIGDAASHATMIMQSRQAKIQRWRPSSAGLMVSRAPEEPHCMLTVQTGINDRPLPPAFNRSTTTGAPAMLAAPRANRLSEWQLGPARGPLSAASSPGEDLPPVPMAMQRAAGEPQSALAERGASEFNFATGVSGAMAHSNTGPDRLMITTGGMAMERTGSANAQIGGFGWIDWMDEYKSLKAEKIRQDAEAAEAARLKAQAEMPPPPVPASAGEEITPHQTQSAQISPVATDPGARDSPREVDLTSSVADVSSAIDLTRYNSRDELGPTDQLRRRSMSIRSQMSALDPTRSPGQRRLSIFERPRQASNGSTTSDVPPLITVGGKKKKNLVNKLEGWWSAVKSNFVPETSLPHQPYRPSNLGVYAERRVPSAPASRRSSGKSAYLSVEPDFVPPSMMRRDTSQSLRNATSHAELRSPTSALDPANPLEPAASITASTSADLAKLARSAMILDTPSAYPSSSAANVTPVARTSLEARRRQPNLRLELEPHVLTQMPTASAEQSSNGSISALPARLSTVNSSQSQSYRPSGHTSRSSSYGQPSMGPGLTPGVQRWDDQSPSPIFALTTANPGDSKKAKPATGAEVSVASVRRHVKHRLNGAKSACDNTLHKVIALITRFADETRMRDEMAMEEKRRLEEQRDYFENISDSPVFDGEESDFESGLGFDGTRSRNGVFLC